MAGRKDIEAGSASIRLFVKKSELLSGLKAGVGDVVKFASLAAAGVAAIGTAAAGAALAAVEHFANSGDEINKMSERTGATVESLSELRYAIGQSGGSLEDLETAMRAIAKKGGTGDPAKKLEEIADELSGIKDPGERAKRAMDLMGKSGTQLLPLMVGGAKGIRDLRKEAQELGQSFGKEDADNATAYGDAWDRVSAAIGGTLFSIGASLAPTMTNLLDLAKQVIVEIQHWVQENAHLLESFEDITGALAGGNFALVGRLAIESLNLAILTGLDTLAGLMSQTLGDTFGTVFMAVMEGDFSKVWDTALTGAAASWDAFVAGITNVFTDAGNILIEVWRKVTSFISDKIIENQAALKSMIDAIPGSSLFGGGEAVLGPDIRPGDVGAAKGIARQQIGGTAAGMSAAIEAQRQAANQRAAESAAALAPTVAGGRSALGGAASDSAMEVASLMEQIKAAAEARRKAAAAGEAGDIDPEGAAKGAASFGTFSAAAAAAAGGAGGMQQRIASALERLDKKSGEEKDIAAKSLLELRGIAAGLTHP